MSVAFRDDVRAAASATAFVSFGTPTGLAIGDLQLVIISMAGTSDDLFRKPGWNHLITDWPSSGSNSIKLGLYWRIYDGTEGNPSFQFYDNSGSYGAVYAAFSGCHPTNPIGGFSYSLNGTDSTTVTIPSVKNKLAGTLAVAIYTNRAATTGSFTTSPAGYTERVDYNPNTNQRCAVGLSDKPVDEGTVAATSAVWSGSAQASIGVHLLLNPDTAGVHVTDWKVPGTVANASGTTIGLADSTDWINPGFANSLDNFRAQVTGSATGYDGDLLKCTNFGFGLPPGATIAGIEVEVEGRSYFTASYTGTVIRYPQLTSALYRAGTAEAFFKINNMRFAAIYIASPSATNPADEVVTVGGLGDVWQADWTKADIEDAGFGCFVLPQLTGNEGPDTGGGNCLIQVDQLRMRVHFIPPAFTDTSI